MTEEEKQETRWLHKKRYLNVLNQLATSDRECVEAYIMELETFIHSVTEAYEDRESDIAYLEKMLRTIDNHIRSTSEPVPQIIEVLKNTLPEYQIKQ